MRSLAMTLRLVQEIAKLVRANLPLEPALTRLAEVGSVPVSEAAEEVAGSLAQGASLREALASNKTRASQMLAASIDVGEAVGKLDSSLTSWAHCVLSGHQHRYRLMTALLYPLALTLIAVCSIAFCVYTLVPQYDSAFRMLTDSHPDWLAWLTWVRKNLWVFVAINIAILLAPINWTVYRRWRCNRWGMPLDVALRLYIHAHTARLANLGLSTGRSIEQLIPSLTQGFATAASSTIDRSNTEIIGKETMAILASLETNTMSHSEAQPLLGTLATQLQLAGDFASQKDARWLPMLVSLVVGLVILISYVVLIYLPWVILFCYMATSTLS